VATAGLLCELIPTKRWTVFDSPGAKAKMAAPAMNATMKMVGLFAMMFFLMRSRRKRRAVLLDSWKWT
jgi:hypothetical protein